MAYHHKIQMCGAFNHDAPLQLTTVMVQVLTMVTLSFTFAGALAGLMGMNLYFAVAETPLVSGHPDWKLCL